MEVATEPPGMTRLE